MSMKTIDYLEEVFMRQKALIDALHEAFRQKVTERR